MKAEGEKISEFNSSHFLSQIKASKEDLLCRWSPIRKGPSLLNVKRIREGVSKKKTRSLHINNLKLATQTDENKNIKDEAQSLISIDFDSGINLGFTKWPEWRLSKLGQTNYLLTLSDCDIASKALELTYYAPSHVKGITLLKPKTFNNKTAIQIVVENGTELIGTVTGHTLTLKAKES